MAFLMSNGQLYKFKVLSYGLCNAPATFTLLMDAMLKGLCCETCLAYLDDIFMFGRTWEEHLLYLRQVLHQVCQAGLKLKLRKCYLARPCVMFLGYIASKDGIASCPARLQTLTDMALPTNGSQVRAFIGLASYYCRFVPQFAMIAHPLQQVTKKKGAVFRWTFQQLRNHLTTAPVVSFPESSLLLPLYTDVSLTTKGTVQARV